MERTIVISDLTRFSNRDIVCTAGLDLQTGECIRPLPYLLSSECRRLNVLPGTVLNGNFNPKHDRIGPHQEDHVYEKLVRLGTLTSREFRDILAKSCIAGIEAGFEIVLTRNQKVLPLNHPVQRSIITVAVPPSEVEIVGDSYTPGKIKLHFDDRTGKEFRFIGITDLGFHDYATQHHERDDLKMLNRSIQAQSEVFLRIGLSREYQAPDGRNGFWLQVNGIYTFPHFQKEIRSYT